MYNRTQARLSSRETSTGPSVPQWVPRVVRIKGSFVTMAQTTKHNEARAGQVACLQHLYPPLVTRAWDRTVSSTIDYRNSSIAPEISINLGLSNKLRFFFPFICFLLWELGFSVKAHEFTYPVCNPSINWKMWGSLWKLQCGEESWHTSFCFSWL